MRAQQGSDSLTDVASVFVGDSLDKLKQINWHGHIEFTRCHRHCDFHSLILAFARLIALRDSEAISRAQSRRSLLSAV